MIQRFSAGGVVIDLDDACVLLEVLDAAAKVRRPGARAHDIARRLRQACGPVNKPRKGSALPTDLRQLSVHDVLTASETALIIGCTTANVRYLRRAGKLPGRLVGRHWLYPAEPVVVYAERRAARLHG